MKRKLLTGFLAMLSISFCAVSCSKDGGSGNPTPNPTPTPSKSRNVKYTLTGNYSAELNLSYFQASGGVGTNPPATALPWEKEINYESSVPGVAFTASGNGGKEGETVTAKIFVNGKEVKTATGITDSRGILVVSTGTHVF